jgi:hypothetical protein
MGKASTAAVLSEAGGRYSMESVELDDLRAGEVYVRIEATMQHVVPMPAVIGHEGVGIVEEVGSGVDYVKVGDRVIISWPACGVCPNCLSGKRYICDEQFGLLFGGCRPDGSKTIKWNGEWISGSFFQQSSFATHAIAPAEALVKVAGDVPPEILAALPCGVMTGAGSVLNAMRVGAQDDLVVFGAGGVGLSGVMAARLTGRYACGERGEGGRCRSGHGDRARRGAPGARCFRRRRGMEGGRADSPIRGDFRFCRGAHGGYSQRASSRHVLEGHPHSVHNGRLRGASYLSAAPDQVVRAGTLSSRSAGEDLPVLRDQRGLHGGAFGPSREAGAAYELIRGTGGSLPAD